MAERKMYEATEAQERKFGLYDQEQIEVPSDEEFKAIWKKSHHGKVTGWGMAKRDWIVGNMKRTREYQMGIWQGRVDAFRGIEYSEERNESTYNLGYYRGYTNWESDRRGLDQAQREAFEAKYDPANDEIEQANTESDEGENEMTQYHVMKKMEVVVDMAGTVDTDTPMEALAPGNVNLNYLLSFVPKDVLRAAGIAAIECTSPVQGGVVTELDDDGEPIRRHEIGAIDVEYMENPDEGVDVAVENGYMVESVAMSESAKFRYRRAHKGA